MKTTIVSIALVLLVEWASAEDWTQWAGNDRLCS